MAVVERFSRLVQGKVESLVCHLHGYGTVDLTPEEWDCLRKFAGFLFQEVEEAMLRVQPRSGA
jgi:sulfite reductase beta subunit-like hemoprotein